MAYTSKGTEEIIATVPLTDFAELRITSIKEEDKLTAVDLRQWYCTQASPEMKPTQKGVRIKTEQLGTVLNILNSLYEESK